MPKSNPRQIEYWRFSAVGQAVLIADSRRISFSGDMWETRQHHHIGACRKYPSRRDSGCVSGAQSFHMRTLQNFGLLSSPNLRGTLLIVVDLQDL
jgi:hypothetical protein